MKASQLTGLGSLGTPSKASHFPEGKRARPKTVEGHFQAVLAYPPRKRDVHVLGGKILPVTMALFFLEAVGSAEAFSDLPRTA